MDQHADENQMLLDELLNQHGAAKQEQPEADFLNFYDDIQHSGSVTGQGRVQRPTQTTETVQAEPQFVYPGSNPAMQHEKLAYMSQNGRSETGGYDSQERRRSQRGSVQGGDSRGLGSQHTDVSFLDDMFTSTASNSQAQSAQQNSEFDNQSITDNASVSNLYGQSFQEGSVPQDLFNGKLDDQFINYADELGSSLGSSIHSELYTPSVGTPTSSYMNSNNLETINALTASSYTQGNAFAPGSLRSPSTSMRPNASYLSTSLRQPSALSNYGGGSVAGNNSALGTSVSRHASTAGMDSVLSTSVPKSLTNLTQDEKLRRKRDFHNAVERRRRDLIKQKINELGNLVPPSLLRFDDAGKSVKPNKGIILNKTVDYVRFLLQVGEAQDHKREKLQNKVRELEDKFNNLNVSNVQNNHSTVSQIPLHTAHAGFRSSHIPEGQEVIIDSRAFPDPHIGVKPELSDDLNQFMSGDIIEAQDNAQLMLGGHTNEINGGGGGAGNAADYLLEFDS